MAATVEREPPDRRLLGRVRRSRRASAYVCEAAQLPVDRSHDDPRRDRAARGRHGRSATSASSGSAASGCAPPGRWSGSRRPAQLFEQVKPGRARADRRGPRRRTCRTPSRVAQPAFFARQIRIATEHSGRIDPESLADYVAAGGYEALRTVLARMTPAAVRDEITQSGLRGRGGAGYSTGLKWTTVAKADGSPKYVICNADEGDPGRVHGPQRPRERSAPRARGDGDRGLRGRRDLGLRLLPRRVPARRRAAPQRRSATPRRPGCLGADILDTRFSFDIEVRLGAGAFVCGEETALIASIEGGRGTPVPRPPYPAVVRAVGPPDPDQQRRDVRQRRPDPAQRRRLVRRRSARRRARAPRSSPSPAGS